VLIVELDLLTLSGGVNILKSSVFVNEKNSYFVTDTKNINIVSKSYSQYVGSLMSYYPG